MTEDAMEKHLADMQMERKLVIKQKGEKQCVYAAVYYYTCLLYTSGIGDPRIDKRIDFIGGIRGVKELERRVSEDMTVAFSMYPTSIQELFEVADAGKLMPPKSTWFEPKLRSGLFIHKLTEE